MKTLLFFTLFISGSAVAQTNVIAAKSHGSDISLNQPESDNFGGSYERFEVYKVEYLGEGCLVEMTKGGLNGWEEKTDTICNHPFLMKDKIDVHRIKKMYEANVEFVGFDELEMNQVEKKRGLKKEKKKKEKSSVLIIFLIGGTLFMMYLFVPKMSLSN